MTEQEISVTKTNMLGLFVLLLGAALINLGFNNHANLASTGVHMSINLILMYFTYHGKKWAYHVLLMLTMLAGTIALFAGLSYEPRVQQSLQNTAVPVSLIGIGVIYLIVAGTFWFSPKIKKYIKSSSTVKQEDVKNSNESS